MATKTVLDIARFESSLTLNGKEEITSETSAPPAVPVEIWHQILEETIALGFIVDTTQTNEGCQWLKVPKYHDREKYKALEKQREALRLVCRSWKEFMDARRWRWIQHRVGATETTEWDTRHLEEVLAHAKSMEEALEPNRKSLKLTRLSIHLNHAAEPNVDIIRESLKYVATNLTILFFDAPTAQQGREILEALTSNASALPSLLCLQLPMLDYRGTPMKSISVAFPRLVGLTLLRGVIPHNPDDALCLPSLETLRIAWVDTKGMRPASWRLPKLNVLLFSVHEGDFMTSPSAMLQSIGANLTLLRLYLQTEAVVLGEDIWRCCPRLKEFTVRLSALDICAPVPAMHPLRYVINVDSASMVSLPTRRAAFQRNLAALGMGIELLIMVNLSWEDYFGEVKAGLVGDVDFLREISDGMEARGGSLQDGKDMTLRRYLETQAASELQVK